MRIEPMARVVSKVQRRACAPNVSDILNLLLVVDASGLDEGGRE